MIEKIITGGQTGADLAALDAALELNINYGGYCPAGRINEDGEIPEKYKKLEEISFNRPYTEMENYEARTIKNATIADGTLILVPCYPLPNTIQDGTKLTIHAALDKSLIINLSDEQQSNIERIVKWVKEKNIKVLNIGGPRESSSPGIYQKSLDFLRKVLPLIAKKSSQDEELS